MPTVNQMRRILIIDDNEAIHGDFRKILSPPPSSSKLKSAKALLFGASAGAGRAEETHFEVESAMIAARQKPQAREGRAFAERIMIDCLVEPLAR